MAKIRDDLEGVVWFDVDGKKVKLAAGDTVPEGIEVGDHLLSGESSATRARRKPAAAKDSDDE